MKNSYSKIFLVCAFCLCMSYGQSVETQFRFHGITDVLPSLSISAIAQDSHGFLWFGTQGGLVRYNGNEYTTYTSIPFAENTLSSNLIQTMLMDKKDVLWVGTYAGLDRYEIATGVFTNYKVGNDIVVSLLRDSSGRLWAGTLNGLGCLKPGTNRFIEYTKESETYYIPDNTIRNMYEDSTGKIFASTYNGLFEYDPKTDSFISCSLFLAGNPASEGVIYGIKEDATGNYWVARWGLGLIKIDKVTHAFTVYPLKDNRIYCINTTFDPQLVLAGTWGGGLNVLNIETGEITDYTQRSRAGSRLTHDIVYSIFIDDTGLLWLGTNGGGLNVYDPKHSWFSSVDASNDPQNGLPSGKTTDIFEDTSGDIWIAVTNKGITRYNPLSGTFKYFRSDPSKKGSLVSDTVFCMLLDSRNIVYIGTDKGLAVYSAKTETFSLVPWFQSIGFSVPQQNISFLSEGTDGSLWIGMYDFGIVRYFPKTGKYVRYLHNAQDSQSISDNMPYFAKTDSRGKVWIGTNKGLNMFDDETGVFTRYMYDKKNRSGISGNTIYSFYEHTDGSLWFGTRNGGLNSFDPVTKIFSHITTEDGLPSNTIVGITPSHGDLLWVATQNGLVQYNIVTKNIYIYKTSDGLLSQYFNVAHATARDGTRYFGTPVGLVYFSEQNVTDDETTVPRVALTSLMINNEQLPVPDTQEDGSPMKLKTEQKNINIGFSALDFSPLARYSYLYKLDGFDSEWIHAGERRFAMYTNLNPGRYLFRVRLDASDNGVNGKETSLLFLVEKPVYLRWYALLLYFAFFLLGTYLFYKIRTNFRLEKKVGELEVTTNNLQSANSHLEVLSYQDALTGIPNRRYFEYTILREWEAAKLRGDYLSILMIDIDFFKLYNDTFGHQAGDEALKKVAACIQGALFRVSDVVARFGGEEFIVVLPDANSENAQVVCERIMLGIAECGISFSTEIAKNLTLSIGSYTGIPDHFNTFDSFILKADEALYRAKKEGRNRIFIYTSSNNAL